MKKNINVPFIAFLAWMAALLTLVSIMNSAKAQGLPDDAPDPAPLMLTWGAQEVSVSLVKQIVIAHVQNTAVDAPCESTYEDFLKSEKAMQFAYSVLLEFTDLTNVEIEIALGSAGYNRAMHWAKWSDPLGHF